MVSFAQPTLWQIRYLVAGISKKNYKSSVTELHHLIERFGYDAQVFFIRTLIEEIELRDVKGGSGGREQLKLQLLQSELRQLENEDQFGPVLCQAAEGSRDGVSEDFLTQLCKVVKLPMKSQFALGVACQQSANDVTHREGAKFLRARLREYTSQGTKAQRLPEVTLHAILAMLRSTDIAEVIEERERDLLVRQLCEAHPDVDVNKGPCAGLLQAQRLNAQRMARQDWKSATVDLPPITASSSNPDGVQVSDLLDEFGHAFSSQSVRDIFAMFPDLDSRGLAAVVAMLVRTAPVVAHPYYGLAATMFGTMVHDAWSDPAAQAEAVVEASTSDGEAKDILALMEEVKACAPNADWTEVFSCLFELPEFRLTDPRSFESLMKLQQACCGEGVLFPVQSVLHRRRCSSTQLQFLRRAVSVDASQVDFSVAGLIKPVVGLPGAEDEANLGGPNHCWACPRFIEMLFELADVEDYGAVSNMFDAPIASMPEALLITICAAEDRSSGTLRADLFEKLVPPLFDAETPHATLTQVTLAERSPSQLKLLLRGMQERNPTQNWPRILDILQKEELVAFYMGLLHGKPSEMSCELALWGASRKELELDSWLRKVLGEHKDVAAAAFVRFLKGRLQQVGSDDGGEQKGVALPPGIDEQALGKMYLDALQEHLPRLNPQAARLVSDLMHFLHHRFPSLTPVPPAEAPTTAAPPPPTEPPPGPPPPPPAAAPEPEPVEREPLPRPEGEVPDTDAGGADVYFQKMFAGEIPVTDMVVTLQQYKEMAANTREHHIYQNMMKNFFTECRFFPRYPPHELHITGEFMGKVLDKGVVSEPANVFTALRCVLEALKRPATTKMFRFGVTALEQMLGKLPRWPQLCQHLLQIETIKHGYPTYHKFADDVLRCLPAQLHQAQTLDETDLQGVILPPIPSVVVIPPPPSGGPPPGPPAAAPAPPTTAPPPPSTAVPDPTAAAIPPQPPPREPPPRAAAAPTTTMPPGPPPPPREVPDVRAPTEPVPTPAATLATPAAPPPAPSTTTVLSSGTSGSATFSFGGGTQAVDSLLNDPEMHIEKPPVWFCDQTAQLFNSLVKDNVSLKAEELSGVLVAEYYQWFAWYLVKNRASKEVNFHSIYIELLEQLKQPRLLEITTNTTYDCLRVCLRSVDQAVVSTSHRTVLKNLGVWLGKITLSRNKPLKSKQFDLKQALLEAFETGRLTAVLPLVCKVLEGVKDSKVYKLPNPWTSAVMSLLAEIHDVPNLRTNLMFEVEVLCKHLDIKIQDLKRSELLAGKKPTTNTNDYAQPRPGQEKAAEPATALTTAPPAPKAVEPRDTAATPGASRPGPDAALTPGTSSLRGEAPAWPAPEHRETWGTMDHDALRNVPPTGLSGNLSSYGYGADSSNGNLHGGSLTSAERASSIPGVPDHEFMVPTMPNLVTINPNISFFHSSRHLRGLVPIAMDKALREVVVAVVERTVMIACLNTKEMVQKDFAMEGDEKLVSRASQLMVASVAGSLALITVREPLRVALQNHLWNLLYPHLPNRDAADSAALEQVVTMVVNDNMEMGCGLIEKAVVDKAMKDIEESMGPALHARKQHKLRSNNPYYDPHFIHGQSKWPQALPDVLRPRPGGTPQHHLKVYKDFNNMPFNGIQPRSPNLPLIDLRGITSHAAPAAPAHEQCAGHGERYTSLDSAEYLEPEVSLEVVGVVNGVLNLIDTTLQAMVDEPPLLPPMDIASPSAYRQDDALDACQSLALLPLNSDLVNLLRKIPHRISSQSTGQPEACAQDLTQKIVKRLYEAPQLVSQLHPPDSISPIHMVTEVYLAILDILKETLKDQLVRMLSTGVDEITGRMSFNVDVVSGLVRYSLINAGDLDRMMLRWLERPREQGTAFNAPFVDFIVLLLQQLVVRQRVVTYPEVSKTIDALTRVLHQGKQQQQQYTLSITELKVLDSITKFMEDVAQVGTEKRKKQTLSARLVERLEEDQRTRGTQSSELSEATIIRLFEDWFGLISQAQGQDVSGSGRQGQQNVSGYLQVITSAGVLSTEESIERFLRIACENAVQRCFTDASLQPPEADKRSEQQRLEELQENAAQIGAAEVSPVNLNFAAVDVYAKLVNVLMKYSDKVQMLSRALSAIAKAIIADSESKQVNFNQRPYFRILLNLMVDMSNPDPAMEQVNFQVLIAFCNTYNQINPLRLPNFAYAWFELVSNRMFMLKLLQIRKQAGWPMLHRFVSQMLYFLEPFLRNVQMNENIRTVYKNTVRMLTRLQQEYPEFVCDYHYSLVENCPQCCVQLRNLILSANPSNMRLPDPMLANLKVDRLQEAKVPPRLLTDYCKVVEHHGVKFDLDNFMRTRERKLLDGIMEKLLLPKSERENVESKYNIPLMNALVLYLHTLQKYSDKKLAPVTVPSGHNSPPLEVFMYLACNLDYEGRYYFCSSMANHLRYPNSHTHYFSCTLLHLFAEAREDAVREQIARVLLERLICHRPHPWGLLITFIELTRIETYDFWNHPFLRIAPEVEKLFRNVTGELCLRPERAS